jgi:hypothetical protein
MRAVNRQSINRLGARQESVYTRLVMHAILSTEPEKKSARNRWILWIALVWLILILKSAILSEVIVRYEVPVGHLWIWGPSIIAAVLISILIWKK